MENDLILKLKEARIDEVLKRNITDFGSGAHAVLPKKHSGKSAIIIIEK